MPVGAALLWLVPALVSLVLTPCDGAAAAAAQVDKSESARQMKFGVKMAENGSWNEAAFRFGKAVEANPDNAFAQNNLGVALESTGQFEKAAAAYAKALALDPGNGKIRENRDRLQAYLATIHGPGVPPAASLATQSAKAPGADPNAAPPPAAAPGAPPSGAPSADPNAAPPPPSGGGRP
jgi:tetratricopeptide (TPR) repeat protein